jgi:hypothetical protein
MEQISNCSVALGLVNGVDNFCPPPRNFDVSLRQDRFLSAGLPHTVFVILSAELSFVFSSRRDPSIQAREDSSSRLQLQSCMRAVSPRLMRIVDCTPLRTTFAVSLILAN